MSKLYFASDTHFGHKNIIKFESKARPFATIEDHDEALVDLWNTRVNKRDTVIHLGDAVFGVEGLDILGRLNGNKILILGNHDTYALDEYRKYFSKVTAHRLWKGFIMTHIPIHPSQFYRFRGNIHGHLHSDLLQDPRYFNVSMEHINLQPIDSQEILRLNHERNPGPRL